MLTAERLRELLHYDPVTGVFTWRLRRGRIMTGSVAGALGSQGYVEIRIDYQLHLAHRLAWIYMTGSWPTHTIDHRDLDRGNNTWSNLREATYSQNNCNRRGRNRTGFKGVRKHGDRFCAQISVSGVYRHLGVFDTRDSAHAAYVAAAKLRFGEYARAQ